MHRDITVAADQERTGCSGTRYLVALRADILTGVIRQCKHPPCSHKVGPVFQPYRKAPGSRGRSGRKFQWRRKGNAARPHKHPPEAPGGTSGAGPA